MTRSSRTSWEGYSGRCSPTRRRRSMPADRLVMLSSPLRQPCQPRPRQSTYSFLRAAERITLMAENLFHFCLVLRDCLRGVPCLLCGSWCWLYGPRSHLQTSRWHHFTYEVFYCNDWRCMWSVIKNIIIAFLQVSDSWILEFISFLFTNCKGQDLNVWTRVNNCTQVVNTHFYFL